MLSALQPAVLNPAAKEFPAGGLLPACRAESTLHLVLRLRGGAGGNALTKYVAQALGKSSFREAWAAGGWKMVSFIWIGQWLPSAGVGASCVAIQLAPLGGGCGRPAAGRW